VPGQPGNRAFIGVMAALPTCPYLSRHVNYSCRSLEKYAAAVASATAFVQVAIRCPRKPRTGSLVRPARAVGRAPRPRSIHGGRSVLATRRRHRNAMLPQAWEMVGTGGKLTNCLIRLFRGGHRAVM